MSPKSDRTSPRSIGFGTFFASLFLVALVSFVGGTRSGDLYNLVAPVFGQNVIETDIDLSSVKETYQILARNFDGELDMQKLIDGANRGLVKAAGDQYTIFMSAEEAKKFNQSLSGELSGIGAEIGVRHDQPTILRLLNNSPASRSGLEVGDAIVAVDDTTTSALGAVETADMIRGEAGTTVKLTVMRKGAEKTFTITREHVSDASVSSRIENGIGFIEIRRFDTDTADLARRAALKMEQADVRGVVLDLRGNGGGYLDQARKVAGIWLDDKLVVTEKQDGEVTDKLNSLGEPILDGVETVVLVNGSSASASEIVAGALRDHDAAKLIGTETFGKGTVQQIFQLSGGRQLKVTIARWFTPAGKNLSESGLTPDEVVKMTAKDVNAGRDPQMKAAVEEF